MLLMNCQSNTRCSGASPAATHAFANADMKSSICKKQQEMFWENKHPLPTSALYSFCIIFCKFDGEILRVSCKKHAR